VFNLRHYIYTPDKLRNFNEILNIKELEDRS
jgi:hypothetical protein